MQWLRHRFGMGFSGAREGAGGAFGATMALLTVLEREGTDTVECGELVLTEAQLLACSLGIRRLQGGAAGGLLFSAKDGTAFLEAGGELLEEFFFPGIQGERISGSPGRWKEWKSPRLRVKNRFAPALRAAKR